MLFISYRREFWSNEFYSNHDEMRDVPLQGVGIETPVSEAQFAKRIRGKSVLLLVHGFNNEREQIIAAYDTIVGNLQAHGIVGGASPLYHEVIGLTWPGGRLDISYAAAKLRASAIADSVFARLRTTVGEAKSVDINTHSLGARVALKALQNAAIGVQSGSSPNAIRIRNLWLTAAAVDNDSIERGEKFFGPTQACETVYVLHSSKDKVLKIWFPIGELSSGSLPDKALGLNGPDNPKDIKNYSKNVKVVDCSRPKLDHGDYKNSPDVFAFYAKELETGNAPQFSKL